MAKHILIVGSTKSFLLDFDPPLQFLKLLAFTDRLHSRYEVNKTHLNVSLGWVYTYTGRINEYLASFALAGLCATVQTLELGLRTRSGNLGVSTVFLCLGCFVSVKKCKVRIPNRKSTAECVGKYAEKRETWSYWQHWLVTEFKQTQEQNKYDY
jgi:hypothetical protein